MSTMIRLKEAAKMIGVPKATVYRWMMADNFDYEEKKPTAWLKYYLINKEQFIRHALSRGYTITPEN